MIKKVPNKYLSCICSNSNIFLISNTKIDSKKNYILVTCSCIYTLACMREIIR